MSSEDKENLLNHNAILYFLWHAGPEDDMCVYVLTHDEFIETFLNEMFEDRHARRMRKDFEEPVKKIAEQVLERFCNRNWQ